MRQDGVYPIYLVHDLRDSQINNKTRKGECIPPIQAEVFTHQGEHRFESQSHCFVKVFMQAQCQPSLWGVNAGRCERHIVMKRKRQCDPLHRALYRSAADLSIALKRVSVAD